MVPSEYFKRQCYIALDVDEEPAVDVVNKLGAEYLSCPVTTRIRTAHSRKQLNSSSACRYWTSSAVRSCGTTALAFTRSKHQPGL
jgi:hypothetical protein